MVLLAANDQTGSKICEACLHNGAKGAGGTMLNHCVGQLRPNGPSKSA
jgi:hypothetical protein